VVRHKSSTAAGNRVADPRTATRGSRSAKRASADAAQMLSIGEMQVRLAYLAADVLVVASR
jgi:hypothetical protein